MARKPWMPATMLEQVVMMQAFKAKIGMYATQLGLTTTQVTAAIALCDAFIGAFNVTELCRSTMQAMTQWRDAVFTGDGSSLFPPTPPVFPVVGDVGYPAGVLTSFVALRDRIVAAEGYTLAIGEDLGIVGPEILKPAPSSIMPILKTETSTGYWVNLTGSMQGMDALKVEYSKDGSDFTTVAFLTNTPGGFQITPTTPGQPEKGFIRAVFIKRNEEVGQYSTISAVTVS